MEIGFGSGAFAEATDAGLRVVVEEVAELAFSIAGRAGLEFPPSEDPLNV